MKKLFFFKLIFDFLFVNSLLAQTNMNDSSSVFTIVEEMPAFKGGEEALFRFLASSVIYPLNAKEKNIQGTVYVTFTVNTKDSLTDIKVIKGVCSDIDLEAIRVITLSNGHWNHGSQNGKAVNVSMMLPIKFALASGSGGNVFLNTESTSNQRILARDINFNNGIMYLSENKLEEALIAFKKAREYDYSDAEIVYRIATVYFQMKEEHKGCNYLRKVKQLNSSMGDELFKQNCKN